MSWLFGGGKAQKPEFTNIAINTSISTLPVPMVWGRAAAGINLLWYGNFQAIAQKVHGGKGGGSGCFAPETMVSTPRGARAIADLKRGDAVWCVNPETGKKVKGRVKLVHVHDVANDSHDRMLRIRHDRGQLHVTENHYLWKDGWEKIEAKDWQVGDALFYEDGRTVAIREIVSAPDIAFTYNLTVEPHHNYFADGVLVHNGGGSKTGSYDYQTGAIFGICCGPISGFGNIWKGKDQYGSPGALGLTAYLGSSSQTAWGWLVSYNASQALNYHYIAYLCSASFDLGSNDALPQLKIETYGALYNTGINGRGDADVPLVAQDYLTGLHGVGLPSDCIDNASWFSGPDATTTGDASWQTYCRALGLDFSPSLASVEKANDVLARWFQITNTAAVWSGSVLKAIPYGDLPVSGNGYVFVPNVTPVYNLTDSDYVRPDNADPVQLIRSDPNDAYNCFRLEFSDNTVLYNANIAEARDQASIEQFGLRVADQIQADEFTQVSVATTAANLICQRSVNIRNTYTFKLSWEYFLLEPMDLVTLTDSGMGMTQVAVRITSIEEDDQGILTIVAEEFPSGTATSPAYPTQTNSSNLAINPAVIPDSVNAPVIFEPDATLTGGTAQVWIAASAGAGGVADPNWGGCNVWLSADGTNYSMVGTITGPARMGVLTSTLGSFTGTNPDNSDTLAANLNESGGTLASGTPADAAAYRTLCYCDGELLSYEAATLTGTGLYNLTTLYRGLYGTTPAAHAAGSQFARLDGAIFEYDLSEDYVGVPITVKLQSFNIWGGGVQDLSTCTAYTYTPVGTGFPLLGASGTYGGVTYNASGQVVAVAPNSGANPYDIAGYLPGIPITGQILFRIEMVRAVTLPAGLTGSRAVCQTAPTNAVTLPLYQSGTFIGSIDFAAGAMSGTFTFAAQVILNPGDVLELDAPNPADATFAGPSYTITGTR
jgi:hypothetical protein